MSKIPEGLPPTVELLLREEVHAIYSVKELHKVLKRGLLKELRTQAEFSLQKWAYPASVRNEPTGDLVVVPSCSMNPLSAEQKCSSEDCRIQSARDFARSIGLFADLVLVPDEFSALLLHKHRDGHTELNLFNALSVLAELLPFLREGILRFHRPGMNLCNRCHKERVEQVKEVTRFLMESTAQEFHIRLQETPGASDLLMFNNPLLLDAHGPLVSLSPISKQESRRIIRMYRRGKDGLLPSKATKLLLPYLESGLAVTVREVLTEVTHARHAKAILTTSSRIEAMLLKQALPWNSPETENWERLRSLQLPWVKDLNTEEIIELRHEATPALGRLCSLLSTRLVDGELDGVRIANELAGEAKEIEAELEAWKKAKGKRFEICYGALGIGLVIYGVAHDTILAAGAALLSSIGKVYGDLRAEKIETAKLRSSPGFVLLKAHQLLKHRAH